MPEPESGPEEPFLVFGRPQIDQSEIDEVVDSMHKAWLGTGPKVSRFESEFAEYKGTDSAHVAAVNSCTAALHISMLAAGIQPGHEVITTPMTFCATVNAILHAGATPVLADIDPLTMNIDPAEIERRITPRTRALVPVHFAGRPCEMASIMSLADRHGLKVIEDCAHAVESELNGVKAGMFGDFGCFSFYATKNVTTGEGGMILARETPDVERAKILALHGMTKDAWKRFGDAGHVHYFVVECGFKYNMMDLQAAIGIHQLARVEQSWKRRGEIWNRYQNAFADLPVTRPANPEPGSRHAYHLYTLLIDENETGISRDAFLDAMIARRIGVGVHYLSLAQHPYYQQRFGGRPGDFPNACRVGEETVSLPLSPGLSDEDVARVIGGVHDALGS